MQRIESLEQYKELLGRTKEKCGRGINNVYFMLNEAERYIVQERMYVEESEAGCVLYVDENVYYQVYIYMNLKENLYISPKDKKCIARLVYKDKIYGSMQQYLAQVLEQNAFYKADTTVQVQGNSREILEKCKSVEMFISRMEKQGYVCTMAEPEQFEEIDQLILSSGVVKDYHMEYRTRAEKEQLDKGSYLCIVKDGEICAASLVVIVNGIAQGGAVVTKEEYKLRGLTPILTYYREKWLLEHNVDYTQGWIVTSNEDSIRYHTRIGFKLVNKYADEWILDKKE